jgi:hypothetical protein
LRETFEVPADGLIASRSPEIIMQSGSARRMKHLQDALNRLLSTIPESERSRRLFAVWDIPDQRQDCQKFLG